MEYETLTNFIRSIVTKQKRDRYAGYFVSEKGRKKFLASLDHDLEKDIAPKVIVQSLPDMQWNLPAVLFSSAGAMNAEFPSLKYAYNEAPWEGGWLAICASGTYGVYRPEGKADNEVFIKL